MSKELTPASCDSCGKEYRVPDPAKTYSCKACGGQVGVDQTPLEALCPGCEETVAAADGFCTHCGYELRVQPTSATSVASPSAAAESPSSASQSAASPATGSRPARTPARTKKRSARTGKERENRRSASGELTKAFKFLKILRTWFLINTGIHAITTALITISFGLEEIETSTSILALAIHGGTTALMLAGYFQVFFRPFLWSVVLAGMVTLSRAISVVQSDFNMIVLVFSAAWALLFWMLVIPTARVRKLIEANPDLYIAKRIAGAARKIQSSRSGKNSAEDLMKIAEKQAWRKSLVGVAVILIASIASSFAIYAETRTPNFEDVWAEFETDWQKGDVNAVSEWFGESRRDGEKAKLNAVRKNRNWGTDWPSLKDHQKEFGFRETPGGVPKTVSMEANLSDGVATLSWRASEGSWHLTTLQLPDPDFAPAAAAWETAWNASDYEALAEFFVDSSKMKRSLRSMADRRDWKALPKIEEESLEDDRAGFRTVYLITEQGEVRVNWKLEFDQWVAFRIKPPKK